MSDDAVSASILLERGKAGDATALRDFLRLAYPELKRIAAAVVRSEWLSNTLQRTVLVHEALLRLFRGGFGRVPWTDKSEFFASATQEMRRVVIEHARRRKALKRGSGQPCVALDDDLSPVAADTLDRLVIINDALEALEQVDRRCARIVDLLFFCSLSERETAAVLDVNIRTVQRDWKFAKAFLKKALSE